MKTSLTQFETMVTFMEQHGNLSKPSGNASGKLHSMQLWNELTTLLNSDGSGDARTAEKWKKVWSDLRNTTKKKAARVHRAASGTGGGLALMTKLTELEQRVLNLIGVQAATGLPCVEAGFSQELPQATDSQELSQATAGLCESPSVATQEEYGVYIISEDWNQSGSSRQPHVAPPQPHITPPVSPLRRLPPNQQTPPRGHVLADPLMLPAAEGQTTPRRRPLEPLSRPRKSPRRRAKQVSATDKMAQVFLHQDTEWRKYLMEKSKREDEHEKERLRLRDIELRVQEQWQEIFNKMLSIINKYLDRDKI